MPFPALHDVFTLSRRDLLRFLAGWLVWGPVGRLRAQDGADGPPPAFGPLLDTLIPKDESPSATELGVDRALLEEMQEQSVLREFTRLGCDWLEREAGRMGAASFADLPEEQRISVVAALESAPANSLQHRFFRRIRYRALFHYYGHPESWKSLGYDGPPQPIGFPSFRQPPRPRS
ncbi:MAG: gluconate 2-dehydrogenase subunit 3 family protein [Xanthomonadales bacterium]|nr:gluconate 2-dehydrogenase subunit 3 family protein [Xanthomonadales bacterium]